MKRSTPTAIVLGCAALLLTASASFAGANGARVHNGEHRLSPERKQASDQAMQAGLSQLQAASAAVQQGGGGQAVGDLQSAIGSMNSALSIYKGHREHSIHAADHAVKELQRNGRRSIAHAAESIGKAISEAQLALQTN